jgi:hypothetical protein
MFDSCRGHFRELGFIRTRRQSRHMLMVGIASDADARAQCSIHAGGISANWV